MGRDLTIERLGPVPAVGQLNTSGEVCTSGELWWYCLSPPHQNTPSHTHTAQSQLQRHERKQNEAGQGNEYNYVTSGSRECVSENMDETCR